MSKKHEGDRPLFVGVDRLKQLFDYSRDTIQEWEKDGFLKEGIHFIRVKQGQRRYNVTLFEDLIVNWNDQKAHEQAVRNYSASLPSSQRTRKS